MEKYISYKILPLYNLVLTNYEGEITGNEYLAAVNIFRSDPMYHGGLNILIDFRNCSIPDLLDKLSSHTKFMLETTNRNISIKVAILVSSSEMDLIMRKYKPIAKLINLLVEPFFDLQEAFAYLDLNEENITTMIQHLDSIKLIKASVKMLKMQ